MSKAHVNKLPKLSQETRTDDCGLPQPEKRGNPASKLSVAIGLMLVCVTVAVFWPVVGFDFFNYDDPAYFSENYRVLQGLTLDNILWAFRTTDVSSWYPLTWLSFMLDVSLFGKGPAGPHLVNLILHTINTLLVFLLLRRMTGSAWRSALVAGLFAIHPLHVESVAWIAERKDVLSTFFGLLSLIFYARYAETLNRKAVEPLNRRHDSTIHRLNGSTINYCLAFLFFALGLLSKPMLVTLPFVLLLLDYWPLCRISDFGFRISDLKRWITRHSSLLLEKVPFLSLGMLAGLVTLLVHQKTGAVTSLAEFPFGLRVQNAFVAYARYLGKTFWPVNLAVPYPHPGRWPLWLVVLGILLVVGLSAVAILIGRRYRYVFTGWFWFFGMLLPVIGIIQWGSHSLGDRFTYVPLIGLFVALVWGAAEVWRRWNLPTAGAWAAAAVILVACAWRTTNQLWLWQDSETLFRHAIAVTENNEVALSNLGVCLAARGKTDEAISFYQRALALNPLSGETLGNLAVALTEKGRHAEAFAYYRAAIEQMPRKALLHLNYGNVLLDMDRVSEAVEAFSEAVRCEPDNPRAHNDLGRALALQGRFEEAVRCYASALKLNPKYAEAHHNWGLALAEQGRMAEAVEHYQAALRLDPNFIEIHHSLGTALTALGKPDEAIAHFRSLLKYKPDHARALEHLGIALAAKGQLNQAVESFRDALRYTTNSANIRYNLGNVLVMQQRLEEAAREFREAVRLDPGHAHARCNLGNVLADMGRRDEAIIELREAARLKPDLAQARERLRQLGEPLPE